MSSVLQSGLLVPWQQVSWPRKFDSTKVTSSTAYQSRHHKLETGVHERVGLE